ncbi:hypothetical protein [Pendulispora albinea]|uniref:Uncharacterized protein n=1 Tax=Pendulispora albinea TaxID=2741071 RepID=A0ABZ2MBB1_9BACT
MNRHLEKATDPTRVAGGATVSLVGIVAIGASALGYSFRYHQLAIPEWLMYVLGLGFIVGGAYLIYQAGHSLRCSACKAFLDDGETIFPGDGGREIQVLSAVRQGDISALRSIVKTSDDFSLKLVINFCAKCNELARLTLLKNDSIKLIENRDLVGAPARDAVLLMQQHGKVVDDD